MSYAAKINTIWSGRKRPGKDEEGTAAAEADRTQNGLKETEGPGENRQSLTIEGGITALLTPLPKAQC